MTDLTTRIQHTDLPASKPPVEKVKPVERKPYKASTDGRDPFEVMGGDRLGDDLDAMFGGE